MGNMGLAFNLIAGGIVAVHSLLNFTLCDKLSDSRRFNKVVILLVCVFNGIVAPSILSTLFDSPMTSAFVCVFILMGEMFFLFKGRITAIFGVTAGSLLHLFVLRNAIIPSASLILGLSMYEITFDQRLLAIVNTSAFVAQIVTLTLFIKLVPFDIVLRIMNNRSFYTWLLGLTIFLNGFIIFNTNIFLVDYFSVALAVQQIVIPIFTLLFFYIMLVLLIKIFSLDAYKEKSKELEEQIDKDKVLTSAALSFAEIIVEVNCTKDTITRVLVNSVEQNLGEQVSLVDFFKGQAQSHLHPEDMDALLGITSKALIYDFEHGYSERMIEYRARKMNTVQMGQSGLEATVDYFWHRLRITTTCNEDNGEIISLFAISEIDGQKQEELLLRKRAETDPLTGAYNREAFALKMEKHIEGGGIGTLYMFDLDNFKGINDNMGHAAGDQLLREIYAKVTAVFREQDIVARLGGDEFVIFLADNVDAETVASRATRICKAINNVYRADNGVEIEISSSVGIARAPKDGTTFDILFKAADTAMYHSKSVGKNTFTVYDSELTAGFSRREKDEYTRAEEQ